MLSFVFFVSAFVLASSISAVACLKISVYVSTWLCVLVANFFENFTFNHRVICTVTHVYSPFSFSRLYKTSG